MSRQSGYGSSHRTPNVAPVVLLGISRPPGHVGSPSNVPLRAACVGELGVKSVVRVGRMSQSSLVWELFQGP